MDTKKQLTLAWTVAGILAVLLVISVYFIMNPKRDLDTVLQDGKEEIAAQRDEIRKNCANTDDLSKKRCQKDLDELADILKDFSKDITKASSTVTIPPAR
ncbi:MAG: hypothetical protein AB199_01005 [Parcubacteria bacterium C7867-004]|nr:MAG: hypothetical protein AB199_01005 [Parcubacteria bacterium C7867-004]